MTLASAHTLLKTARPAIQPNAGFMRQLTILDQQLSAKRPPLSTAVPSV
jgi:hypothetical protein